MIDIRMKLFFPGKWFEIFSRVLGNESANLLLRQSNRPYIGSSTSLLWSTLDPGTLVCDRTGAQMLLWMDVTTMMTRVIIAIIRTMMIHSWSKWWGKHLEIFSVYRSSHSVAKISRCRCHLKIAEVACCLPSFQFWWMIANQSWTEELTLSPIFEIHHASACRISYDLPEHFHQWIGHDRFQVFSLTLTTFLLALSPHIPPSGTYRCIKRETAEPSLWVQINGWNAWNFPTKLQWLEIPFRFYTAYKYKCFVSDCQML